MEELELLIAYVLFYGALEMLYLKLATPFYQRNFAVVQSIKQPYVNLGWAALAYVALFVTVYRFVIRPIFVASSMHAMPTMRATVANATLMAVAIYGVYNLTNLATLKGYAPLVAAVDVTWGIAAVNVVAGACYMLKAWVMHR